mmetsp:Transcript_1877/g.4966  ORF Transcript_1877/g.4966 Transcript_1877/m.4966 type:complete len:324 (-) Transcript_1877:502-1473(-)
MGSRHGFLRRAIRRALGSSAATTKRTCGGGVAPRRLSEKCELRLCDGGERHKRNVCFEKSKWSCTGDGTRNLVAAKWCASKNVQPMMLPDARRSSRLLRVVRQNGARSLACNHERGFCSKTANGGSRDARGGSESETEKKELSRAVWTIPNVITFTRLACTPLLALAIVRGEFELAFCGVAAAALSDVVDGYLARALKQQTVLGSYLDPLSDKLMIASVFAALGVGGQLSSTVVIVVLSRDVALIAGTFALRNVRTKWRTAPSLNVLWISRVNTLLQVALGMAALLNEVQQLVPLDNTVAFLEPVVIITTVSSGVAYALRELK